MSLPHAIRGFLALAPMTGYELKAAFGSSVAHFWPADQAQIYRELRKLAQAGDVRVETVPQEGRPTRKVHHLTEEGRESLQVWLKSAAPEPTVREPRLVQLFFAEFGDLTLLAEQLTQQLEEVRGRQATFKAILQEGEARWEAAGRHPRGWFQLRTLAWGMQVAEAEARWLTDTLAGLTEVQS